MEERSLKKPPLLVLLLLLALAFGAVSQDRSVHPAKLSQSDLSGAIFEHGEVTKSVDKGNTTLDVTSLLSSDKKFGSGVYRSGKVRYEIDEPYGVDEFMYFLEGGVTLTSSDGTQQVINAGEAVTIPKEWTGIWETDGYTKIWVIYSENGSGLE